MSNIHFEFIIESFFLPQVTIGISLEKVKAASFMTAEVHQQLLIDYSVVHLWQMSRIVGWRFMFYVLLPNVYLLVAYLMWWSIYNINVYKLNLMTSYSINFIIINWLRCCCWWPECFVKTVISKKYQGIYTMYNNHPCT